LRGLDPNFREDFESQLLWPLHALVVHFSEDDPLTTTFNVPVPEGTPAVDLSLLVICEGVLPLKSVILHSALDSQFLFYGRRG
jgi:hypothetical protein